MRPIRPFDPPKGNWGAFERALRYDRANLTDLLCRRSIATRMPGPGGELYLTGNVKLMFNHIRFEGPNSRPVVAPVSINGAAAKGDALATRRHLDA